MHRWLRLLALALLAASAFLTLTAPLALASGNDSRERHEGRDRDDHDARVEKVTLCVPTGSTKRPWVQVTVPAPAARLLLARGATPKVPNVPCGTPAAPLEIVVVSTGYTVSPASGNPYANGHAYVVTPSCAKIDLGAQGGVPPYTFTWGALHLGADGAVLTQQGSGARLFTGFYAGAGFTTEQVTIADQTGATITMDFFVQQAPAGTAACP